MKITIIKENHCFKVNYFACYYSGYCALDNNTKVGVAISNSMIKTAYINLDIEDYHIESRKNWKKDFIMSLPFSWFFTNQQLYNSTVIGNGMDNSK